MDIEKKLEELAQTYEISLDLVGMYKNKLALCPLLQGDDESLLECLEEFISERSSYDLKDEFQPLDYTYSNVLYRKFGDQSIPYLNDSYKELYQITKNSNYERDLMKEESTFEEEIYDYHGITRK